MVQTPRRWIAAALLGVLAGCAEPRQAARSGAFAATGELIAFSGADAGARNACVTCHGLRGEGDAAGSPRLAGLPAGYLAKQLIDYADGRRRHDAMRTIAQRLSWSERRMVAAYFAALPSPPMAMDAGGGPPPTAIVRLYHAGDASRGLAACASCHGERGEGLGAGNPPLYAQPSAYLAEQLEAWRAGRRQNSPLRVMLAVSQRLTPAEREAISVYAAQLPGPVPAAPPQGPEGPGP